jgi:hypothetical protein
MSVYSPIAQSASSESSDPLLWVVSQTGWERNLSQSYGILSSYSTWDDARRVLQWLWSDFQHSSNEMEAPGYNCCLIFLLDYRIIVLYVFFLPGTETVALICSAPRHIERGRFPLELRCRCLGLLPIIHNVYRTIKEYYRSTLTETERRTQFIAKRPGSELTPSPLSYFACDNIYNHDSLIFSYNLNFPLAVTQDRSCSAFLPAFKIYRPFSVSAVVSLSTITAPTFPRISCFSVPPSTFPYSLPSSCSFNFFLGVSSPFSCTSLIISSKYSRLFFFSASVGFVVFQAGLHAADSNSLSLSSPPDSSSCSISTNSWTHLCHMTRGL